MESLYAPRLAGSSGLRRSAGNAGWLVGRTDEWLVARLENVAVVVAGPALLSHPIPGTLPSMCFEQHHFEAGLSIS